MSQITARELNETEKSNIYDREFKLMARNIPTGLEKRVEDHSETLNKEIHNIG